MKHVFNAMFVASLGLGVMLTTIVGGVRDAATATKALQSTITFPAAEFYYSADVWKAGCGDSAGNICGTAREIGGSISSVQVSLQRESDEGDGYWDGFGFNSTAESFITANGTTQWSLEFPFDRFPPGVYTVHSQVIDGVGEIHSGSLRIFSVSPEYTVIPIISSLVVMDDGDLPTLRKVPLKVELKAEALEIFSGTMKSIPSTSRLLNAEESNMKSGISDCRDSETDDCAIQIRFGNADAYLYEIMVPSNTKANRAAFGISGDYRVIGKSSVCAIGAESYDAASRNDCTANGGTFTSMYTSADFYSVQSGTIVTEKHLNVAVDGRGKVHSMRSRQIEGTPLVISVPAYSEIAEATELLPILYESFDGDWNARILVRLRGGVDADTFKLELKGGDVDTVAAEVAVHASVGDSHGTELTHQITYRGQTFDIRMFIENEKLF